MGCCISKCEPEVHSNEESNVVEDKLVISQQALKIPKIKPLPSSNKISPSPPSPTTSTSSVSSFSCTNSNTTTTTAISSSSSILTSKDRSFSNEFLWSCVNENPHIIRINSIKECSDQLLVHARKLDSPAKLALPQPKQPIPQRVNASTPQKKRIRSISPATPINRQKSFRRELERVNSSYSSMSFRSPSPSRRFSNGNGEICSRRIANTKVNAANDSSTSSLRRENFSPCLVNSSPHLRSRLRNINRETCIHRISSKIDQVAVEHALAHHDSDSVPMEDIDNPLISLDCFIFL